MSLDVKYIPLSFIKTNEEILRQIKNTVLFTYLLNKYEETTLEHYLDSTQYGFTASGQGQGSHKFVRITDIQNGNISWEEVPYCDCNSERKYLLKQNDILIARTGGTTGKSFLVNKPPENAVFASYLIRLRINQNADIEFINAYLNSYVFWNQIIEMKSGSAMPNVNAEKLKTLRLPKCSYVVQKEIMKSYYKEINPNLYKGLFQKIKVVETVFENNQYLSVELTKQMTDIKKLRQAFLREAMQGKLVPRDPNDEPASELLKKIKAEKAKLIAEGKLKKQKPLPEIKPEEIPYEIPKSWAWCRLGDICTKITDGFHNTPPKIKTGFPYISATHVKSEEIDWAGCDYVSEVYHRELFNKAYPQKGELLLVNIGAGCGTPSLIDVEFEFSFKNTAILKFDQKLLINKFILYFFLLSRNNIYNDLTQGGLQPFLSLTILNNIIFPLPPLTEQQKIVIKLNELIQFCDQLEENIKKTREQSDMLLQTVLKEALEPKGEIE